MSEDLHLPDGRVEHPDVRSEPNNVSFRVILGILVGAAVVLVVIFIGVWLFFLGWRDHEDTDKKSPFPLAATPDTALPHKPRLEQLDRLAGVQSNNVYERQLKRETLLNRFGKTEQPGYVHIPINQAMDVLLARKLRARNAPPADEERRSTGLVDAGAPNSGRVFRREQP